MKRVYSAICFVLCLMICVSCTTKKSMFSEAELIALKEDRAADRIAQRDQGDPFAPKMDHGRPEINRHSYNMRDTVVVQADGTITGLESREGAGGGSQPFPLNPDGTMAQVVVAEDEELMVSVEAMELNSFIHLIFGSYLKVNYMVDPNVEKRTDSVTIHMQESVQRAAFRKLIRELLKKYKVGVRKKEGVVFLEPLQKGKVVEEDYLTFTGHSLPDTLVDDEQVLILVPFKYVDPGMYIGVFNRIHPLEGSEFRMQLPGNSMMIKGLADSVRKLLALVRSVDKPYLQDQLVRLLGLDYIQPEDLIERLKELLPSFGVPVYAKNSKSGIRLLPMPEISSLFLLSPEEEWLDVALRLTDQLDGPMALGPEPRIFIYRPENRKASVLAEIIMGLRSGGNVDEKPPVRQAEIGVEEKKGTKKMSAPPKVKKTGGTALKEGKLVITVDEGRNALVIYTTPTVYQELEKVLKNLDTLTRQVLIEITIAEVTLTDSLQYGVEWFLSNSGNKGLGVISTLGNLGVGGSGAVATFISTVGDFRAVLNAFAKDDLINILANPRLVVLDNESASFSVGTDVPVVTSEATAADLPANETTPSVLRNIEYRKTGISVEVTPTIYSNGTLRLDISQNLSEAQKNDVSPDTGSPLILDRTSHTTVILKSGEAVLLAGLISETKSGGNQRIPLLGDIPLIGNLFKTTSEQTTRTELMMQVRPIILDDPRDMRIQTLEFHKIVKDLHRLNKFFVTESSESVLCLP